MCFKSRSLCQAALAVLVVAVLCGAAQRAAAYVPGDSVPIDEVGEVVDVLRLGFDHWSAASGDPTGDTYHGVADVDDAVGDHQCTFTVTPYQEWDAVAEDYGCSYWPFTLDPNNVMNFVMTAPEAGQYVVAFQALVNSAGHYFLEYQKDGNWIQLPEFGTAPGDPYQTIIFSFVVETGAGQTEIPMKFYSTAYKLALSGIILAKFTLDPFEGSATSGYPHGNILFDPNEASEILAKFTATPFLSSAYADVRNHANAFPPLYNSITSGKMMEFRKKLLINAILSIIEDNPTRLDVAIQLIEKPLGWGEFRSYGSLHHGGLIRTLAIAYDILYDHLTETQRDDIRRLIDKEARALYVESITQDIWALDTSGGNWQAVCHSGMGAAGMVLRNESRYAQQYFDWALYQCKVYLRTMLGPDGSCYEAYGSYFNYGLGNLTNFFVMLKNVTGEDLFGYDNNVIQKTVPYSLYLMSPIRDGFSNLDDTDYGYYMNGMIVMSCLARYRQDPLAQWLVRNYGGDDSGRSYLPGWRPWERIYPLLWYDPNMGVEDPDTSARTPLAGAFIADPAPETARWGNGYVVMRTGFTSKDDIALMLQCGDSGGYHGHADQGSFLLTAYGGQLVSHVGKYGSYSGAGNAWAHSSKGNSVMLIDGRGQVDDHKFGNGRKKRDGTVDDFYHDANIADYVLANSKKAYDDGNNPVDHALRHVLFVRKPLRRGYFVIADDVQSSEAGEHDYSWLLHSAAYHNPSLGTQGTFRFTKGPMSWGVSGFEGRDSTLQVMFARPQDPTMVRVASEAGTSFPPYVKSTYRAQRGVFVALLYPENDRLGISTPAVTRIDEGELAGFAIEDDLVLFHNGASPWQYQDVETDARMIYLDFSVEGQVSYLVANATTLSVGRAEIFDANTPTTTSGTAILPDVQPPTIQAWYSAAEHGRGAGEALLEILDDGSFSEPRSSGISKLILAFDEPIDPTSFSLMHLNVELAGRDANGNVQFSGISISISMRNGDTEGVITFSPPLPDYARYLLSVSGITDVAGNPLAGDADRIMTALAGDVSCDLRVNATDLSRVRAARMKSIDPNDAGQVRADVNFDGRVNATDISRVRRQRGNDARGIEDPLLIGGP